jgi:hypothetical protein
MNKLIRAVVLTTALVAGFAVVGVPSSAQAATHDNNCQSGESCVFADGVYGGGMDDMATTDSTWVGNTFSSGGSVNDGASSGFGNDRGERYYVNINFGGYWFTLGPNQYDPYWTTNQPFTSAAASYDFNNKISSNSIYVP